MASWDDVLIHPTKPGHEHAPSPDEGYVKRVDTDNRDTGSVQSFIRCQECGRSVEWTRPHVRAVVVLEGDEVWPHPRMKRVDFCDRECWAAWATTFNRQEVLR